MLGKLNQIKCNLILIAHCTEMIPNQLGARRWVNIVHYNKQRLKTNRFYTKWQVC